MQPIPVSILFSLFIVSSIVCNEQSPDFDFQSKGRSLLKLLVHWKQVDSTPLVTSSQVELQWLFDLQSNVHGRHFSNPLKIAFNAVSPVGSNAAKGIDGVIDQAADAETKSGNAVSSGIDGIGKLASAGSNVTAGAVETLANMTGNAVRAIGDIAAFKANMASGAIKGAGQMADSFLSGLGYASLGSSVSDGTNKLGDVASKIGSAVDEEFDALGDVVGGEEIGNKINTSMAVEAVNKLGDAVSSGINGVGKLASSDYLIDGASKAGQMAESGVKAASDAVSKVAGDVAGQVDSAVGAIADGASKGGEMASNGVKATGDAASAAVGALTGAVSGLFG